MRPTISLVLLIALVGCNALRGESGEATVTVDSTGAYPVIQSAGAAPQWRAELVTTIGADSAAEPAFGTVNSVLLDSAGDVYVLDPSFKQLSVFSPDGTLRGRLGRRGSGPGEYTLPYSIAWIGDSLAMMDPGNARVSLLGPDGKWVRQWVMERITGSNIVRFYRTPPHGFWTIATRRTNEGTLARLFVRYTSQGPSDTLVYFMHPQLFGGYARCDTPDGGFTSFEPPFGPLPLVIPNAAGEQVVAVSSGYRIAFVDRELDTVRVITRTVDAAPISDAEWAEASAEFIDWKRKNPAAHCNRDGWDRPATKPPLQWQFVDDEGQLWVEVLTRDGRVYDVFGPDGALRGTVTGLPSVGGVDPSVVNGRIALVAKDSLDVQVVQVFRIRKP